MEMSKKCPVCGAVTEREVIFFGKRKTVGCICECEKEKIKQRQERERKSLIEEKRIFCFDETEAKNYTFENDDGKNAMLTKIAKNYVKNFTEFKFEGKGLLFYGSVGTGKSYVAACIANALIDKGYTVKMTNFAKIIKRMQGKFDGRQEYIDSFNKFELLIIDDLGIERQSEFAQEVVFDVIDSRYKTGLPMIVTTNLLPNDFKAPNNVTKSRIYDRILEKCFPVEVKGVNRRREKFRDGYAEMKKVLGL